MQIVFDFDKFASVKTIATDIRAFADKIVGESSDDAADGDEKPAPKKRGRPAKEKEEEVDDDPEETDAEDPEETEEEEDEDEDEKPAPKKGRKGASVKAKDEDDEDPEETEEEEAEDEDEDEKPAKSAKGPKRAEVSEAFKAFINKDKANTAKTKANIAEGKKILKRFGADKVLDLDESDFPAVLKALKKAKG